MVFHLIDFLVEKEGISRADAERKRIRVTSGIPSGVRDKARVEAACPRRDDRDSPERRRTENLALLAEVDRPGNPVEWIVSVSMLTEGWDVFLSPEDYPVFFDQVRGRLFDGWKSGLVQSLDS